MKRYNQLFFSVIIIVAIMAAYINVFLFSNNYSLERPYMVEIERMAGLMSATIEAQANTTDRSGEEGGSAKSSIDLSGDIYLSKATYVRKIIKCENDSQLTASSRYNYCIKSIGDDLYRFEYEMPKNSSNNLIIIVNSFIIILTCLVLFILMYIKKKIITPFNKIEDLPYELSKGNLSYTLYEEKSKYFGKFVWGLNMLSDNIRKRRENELELHKEKKLSLLSLTHDIKTPLSVIKLNAQAIQKGLYKEENRKIAAAEMISQKVDEIENYVNQITKASKEDFLDLSVKEEEFYLDDVIDKIEEHYAPKLEIKKTEFQIKKHTNALLVADKERVIEVLQNLMENAIKYGDGKQVIIDFSKEEDCLLLSIINSGATLDKGELSKVFDSFYRGSNTKNLPGSGLGLYICRQLMTKMNGDIYIKENNDSFEATLILPYA